MQGFGGRQVGDALAEQHARQHLVLRQGRGRGEGDVGLHGRTADLDDAGDVLDDAAGVDRDFRIGQRPAVEADRAVVDIEVAPGKGVVTAHRVHLALDAGIARGADQMQVHTPFGFQPHARNEDMVVGAGADIELPQGWRRQTRLGGLDRLITLVVDALKLVDLGSALANDGVAQQGQAQVALDQGAIGGVVAEVEGAGDCRVDRVGAGEARVVEIYMDLQRELFVGGQSDPTIAPDRSGSGLA